MFDVATGTLEIKIILYMHPTNNQNHMLLNKISMIYVHIHNHTEFLYSECPFTSATHSGHGFAAPAIAVMPAS